MLIAESFLLVLLDTMEIILFPPMAVHGIHKPVSFSKWLITFIPSYEKSMIERNMQYIKDRTEMF